MIMTIEDFVKQTLQHALSLSLVFVSGGTVRHFVESQAVQKF